jgi:hypothetical protein
MVVQHLGGQNGGGGQGTQQAAGGQAQPSAQIPLKDVLQLALGNPGGAGDQGQSGGASLEMQLSQELAANLQKLKAILADTQELAQRIESALQEPSLMQGAGQGGAASSGGQGRGRHAGRPRSQGG